MIDISPEKKLLDIIKQAHGKLRFKKELKVFTRINIILIVLIIVILGGFLVDIFISDYSLPELSLDLDKQDKEVLPVTDDIDDELFDLVVETKDSSVPDKELVKHLNLLGIVTGEDNQAIIQDRSTQKTFFLYKGDSFGEFMVYDIKDSRVILEYKGQKIELKM